MSKTVNFRVGMSCQGCANAVTKILTKIEGVSTVEANVTSKNVAVVCQDSVDPNTLLEALNKWSATSKKSVELL